MQRRNDDVLVCGERDGAHHLRSLDGVVLPYAPLPDVNGPLVDVAEVQAIRAHIPGRRLPQVCTERRPLV